MSSIKDPTPASEVSLSEVTLLLGLATVTLPELLSGKYEINKCWTNEDLLLKGRENNSELSGLS